MLTVLASMLRSVADLDSRRGRQARHSQPSSAPRAVAGVGVVLSAKRARAEEARRLETSWDRVRRRMRRIITEGSSIEACAGDVPYIPKGSRGLFGTPNRVRVFYVTYSAKWAGPKK